MRHSGLISKESSLSDNRSKQYEKNLKSLSLPNLITKKVGSVMEFGKSYTTLGKIHDMFPIFIDAGMQSYVS